MGQIATSTNPTGGSGAWTVNKTVDRLFGVSCPGSGFCVAVDDVGDVVVSTNPTGGSGAWTIASVDGTNWLSRISCKSSNLCVAYDNNGNAVSGDPTSSVAAWKVTKADATNVQDASCPSSKLCFALDRDQPNVIIFGDPALGKTAWTSTVVESLEYTPPATSASPWITVATLSPPAIPPEAPGPGT
jgi:hypothetical protein